MNNRHPGGTVYRRIIDHKPLYLATKAIVRSQIFRYLGRSIFIVTSATFEVRDP
ncbi:hypothetical protein D9M68_741700 [compost metagenome]